MVGDHKIQAASEKIYRIRDRLVAAAGASTDCERFLQWVRAGCEGNPPRGEYEAFVIGPDSSHHFEDGARLGDVPRPGGLGTGGAFAVAAMMAGASAKQAVGIAIELDTHSGGPVHCLRLKKPRSRK